VVSVAPKPRVELSGVAEQLNGLEENRAARWWATPSDWTVPELGFGEPVTFHLQGVRFDPTTENDPASSLPVDTVVAALCEAFQTGETLEPKAASSAAAAPDATRPLDGANT
jgi:hypothetical protein